MYEEMKEGRMTEIKKAPARTGANANTVVIAPFTKAFLTRVQAIYNGNEVIAGG